MANGFWFGVGLFAAVIVVPMLLRLAVWLLLRGRCLTAGHEWSPTSTHGARVSMGGKRREWCTRCDAVRWGPWQPW